MPAHVEDGALVYGLSECENYFRLRNLRELEAARSKAQTSRKRSPLRTESRSVSPNLAQSEVTQTPIGKIGAITDLTFFILPPATVVDFYQREGFRRCNRWRGPKALAVPKRLVCSTNKIREPVQRRRRQAHIWIARVGWAPPQLVMKESKQQTARARIDGDLPWRGGNMNQHGVQ